jgi:uncharacterized protein (TIGR00288 family)
MPETSRVAVLIDCDNIGAKWAEVVFAETAKHGMLSVKRAYGDWSSARLAGWRAQMQQHAVQPVQQFAYTTGKNATDSALIIDAMDLLYTGNIDTFCLVTSDSDFTRLATRLREAGKRVYGIGSRNASTAFQNACDRFTYVEVVAEASAGTPPDVPDEPVDDGQPTSRAASLKRAQKLLVPAVEATAKEDGWASLSAIGQYVVNRDPAFDSRNFGFAKLGLLVREVPGLEVKEVSTGADPGQIWVRTSTAGGSARSRKAGAKKGSAKKAVTKKAAAKS